MVVGYCFQNMFNNLNDADLEAELPESVVCWLFESITQQARPGEQKIETVVVLQALETLSGDLEKFK